MNKKKWIKTLQFMAAYLVAAWTFLQFVDWVLNRYNISPYWVDILLWIFIGIIPSLMIYLYNRERINKRILKLREKIIFPLNIIVLMIALYFGFGNSDLGATTKDITFENEEGKVETKTITKEEFRIGVPIYNFKQEVEDSTSQWMSYGIGKLLTEDLMQNKSLSPDYSYLTTTTDKIREASLFYDIYVDGKYKKIGDEYEITTYIRKANNGKKLKELTVKGKNVLQLLDEISVFITSQAGFVESNNLNYIDLPINEFMSNSLEAIEAFVDGNYSKAYTIDKKFALAYLENAKRNSLYNRGKLETQDIIDKAFALKNKLPLQKQLEVYIQRSLAYNLYDEAEKQVKLQLEVDPNNDFYNQVLFSIYGDTRKIDSYLEKSQQLFDDDPKPENGMNLAQATLVNGGEKTLLDALKPYEVISPNVLQLKLAPLVFLGKIEEAEDLLEAFKVESPNDKRLIVYDSIIDYHKHNSIAITDYNDFVGEYISSVTEQTMEFWIDNNRLIQYVSHQRMKCLMPAGENAIGGGYIGDATWKLDLIRQDNGKPIGIMNSTYYWNRKIDYWYWKLDDTIIAANNAFEKKDYEAAERLYNIALKQNPKHAYLKHLLSHLAYDRTKGKDSIQLQNKRFSGTYGSRRFWIENGDFYYKRKSESVDLPKVKLLPISDSTYLNLSKLGTIMQFEATSNGDIASVPYSYDVHKDEWIRQDTDNNYLVKD